MGNIIAVSLHLLAQEQVEIRDSRTCREGKLVKNGIYKLSNDQKWCKSVTLYIQDANRYAPGLVRQYSNIQKLLNVLPVSLGCSALSFCSCIRLFSASFLVSRCRLTGRSFIIAGRSVNRRWPKTHLLETPGRSYLGADRRAVVTPAVILLSPSTTPDRHLEIRHVFPSPHAICSCYIVYIYKCSQAPWCLCRIVWCCASLRSHYWPILRFCCFYSADCVPCCSQHFCKLWRRLLLCCFCLDVALVMAIGRVCGCFFAGAMHILHLGIWPPSAIDGGIIQNRLCL